MPWIGNNAYLDSLLLATDSGGVQAKMPSTCGGIVSHAKYHIPVQFWLWRDNTGPFDGAREILPYQTELIIRELNEDFTVNNNMDIAFYSVGSPVVTFNLGYADQPSNNQIGNMFSSNRKRGTLNIHLVLDLEGKNGRANLPSHPVDGVLVVRYDAARSSTVPHEVGHALGLVHTHDGQLGILANAISSPCYQETVNRSDLNSFYPCFNNYKKCEHYGDGLCDTPADPKLGGPTTDGFGTTTKDPTGNWVYTPNPGGPIEGVKDSRFVDWDPDGDLIMSYGFESDRTRFTNGQKGIMHFWVKGEAVAFADFFIQHDNDLVDILEPDNFFENAISFQIGDQFDRTLHPVYEGEVTLTYNIDEDWYQTIIPQTAAYNFWTTPVISCSAVDTKITIYPNAGTLSQPAPDLANPIAVSDNISGSNLYSELLDIRLDRYDVIFVKVESSGPDGDNGYYTLNTQLCEIDCCWDPFIGSTTALNPSSGSFNIGAQSTNSTSFFGSSLTVSNSLFGHNVDLPLGFGGNGNPIFGSNADITICNNAHIDIQNEGVLKVGDGNTRTAEVKFSSGTKLFLRGNSFLIIANNSVLRIEDGAEVILEQGANIDIAMGSTLEIQGKLTLAPNATLTTTGPGHLVFDQNIPWVNGSQDYTNYYEYGANCKIDLQGSSQSDVVLECKNVARFLDEQGNAPVSVEITSGTVLLHENAFVYTFSPTQIFGTHIKGAVAGQQPHGGIRMWYNTGFNRIKNCTIEGGSTGVWAQWVGGTNQLLFENNLFKLNTNGIFFEGGRLRATGNTFINNSRGLATSAMQGASSLGGNTFKFNNRGTTLHGSKATLIDITNNLFQSNLSSGGQEGAGVMITELTANFHCNDFVGNEYGIWVNLAHAFLQDGANNYFFGNDVGIRIDHHFDEPSSLYLRDGYNEFLLGNGNSANRLHLLGIFPFDGDFASSLPRSDYVLNTTTNLEEMDATNNRFELKMIPNTDPNAPCCAYEMPVDMNVDKFIAPGYSQLFPVKLYLPTNLASVQRDCNSSNGGGENPTLGYLEANQGLTEGGVFDATSESLLATLSDGIAALSYGENDNNDLVALGKFQFALTGTLSNTDNSTDLMLRQAHDLMLSATENSYLFGDLPHTGGNYALEKPTELTATLGIIGTRLTGLSPQDSSYSYWNFKLHLDKALTYRNAGYYPDALQVLATEGLWATGQQLQRTGFWNCICQAEKDYFDETIAPEEYGLALENCRSLYAGASYKRQPGSGERERTGYLFSEPSLVEGLKFYPQPATDYLTLELPEGFAGEMKYDITSTDGRLVRSGSLKWDGGSQNTLDLKPLSPGIYILGLTMNGQVRHVTVEKW